MAQQDLSSKVLESHNEIFANIFNTFVFGGKHILNPEHLQDEPTENIFLDNDGKLRNNLRDVFKTYKVNDTGTPVRLAYLGIENQSYIDQTMVVRLLSYTANCYKKQCDEFVIARQTLKKQLKQAETNEQKEYCLKQLKIYDKFKLVPAITLVLNFSKNKWTNSLSLTDIVDDNNPFKNYMHDFQMHVINVMYLTDSEISNLSNDFKALVEFLVKQETSSTELQHPIDVLMALYAYTNDPRFLAKKNDILQKVSKGGIITMPEILDAYIEKRTAEIVAEVTAEVTAERNIQIAKNLIDLGSNSLDDIAKVTGLPLDKVQKLAKEQVA